MASENLQGLPGVEECIHWYPPNLEPVEQPEAIFRSPAPAQGPRDVDLFVHVPFCSSKCGFCPFNVFRYEEGESRAYLAALEHEVRTIRSLYDLGQVRLRTAWVGGGTPSTLEDDALDALLGFLRASFDLSDAVELTVEVKPDLTRLTAAKLGILRDHGVSRVSMGVQSTRQEYLTMLGRRHEPPEALQVIDAIKSAGFPLNIDMMYRLPGQTLVEVVDDLDAVRSLGIDHISWFPYVAHEGTGLAAKVDRGKVAQPTDRAGYLEMFTTVLERMDDAGYEQYTPYHFAGTQRCEYHVDRWGMPQLETLGLGAGAFSFFNGWTYANEHDLNRYRQVAELGRPPVMIAKQLSPRERTTRLAVLGSKLFELEMDAFHAHSGVRMEDFYEQELALLERLGLVEVGDGRVVCTMLGRAFSNDIALVLGTDAARRVPQPQGVQLQRSAR